ncbi:MAG: response regulator [Bacteroidota bacterium]
MDELRALYRSLLADHRHNLETLRAQAMAGEPAAWDSILREAHTLKGSGGQFGYPEITNAARTLREAPEVARPDLLDALLEVVVACMEGREMAPCPPVSGPTPPTSREREAAARHVLVVEDDPLIGSVICNALRRHGATPTHCDLGTKAVAMLFDTPDAPPFDLVLLDISMPGMSGLEVLARIRREPATADLPVMMVSAHNDASTITYARSLGADDYLTKPFAPKTLLRHIEALVAARDLGTPVGVSTAAAA